jgi:hypothetical protein
LYLFARPVVVRVVLYLFEVGYRHASRIREDIWDHSNSLREEYDIRIRSDRPIGEFHDEFGFYILGIIRCDLVLQSGWDEDITVEFEEL